MIHNSTVEPFLNDPELKTLVQKMEPTGRLWTPKEVAEAAVWLCSDDVSFVNGVSMPVYGGMTVGRVPRRT